MITYISPAIDRVEDIEKTDSRTTNTACDLGYIYELYSDINTWETRKASLRKRVMWSAGLIPEPKTVPLDLHIVKEVDFEGYLVQSLYFQSLPGLFVTGNLYRPKKEGIFPAILNPHGHWKNGRFEDTDETSVPGRCINFALQGYVAFSYDMIGFGDSFQFLHSVDAETHGNYEAITNGKTPDRDHDTVGYSLYHKLWGISIGGLQTWNSIRAIDMLQSLPYVDGDRIGCTGASGGGTQTFLLAVIDNRIKAAAPVNMISAHMQGGCLCENLPGLRIGTNNVELAAAIAPRPLIMICATGDWTNNTPEVEYPAVQHIYSLYGAEDKVTCKLIDADHNYNLQSREAVYKWFAKWLLEDKESENIREIAFTIPALENLRIPPQSYMKNALDSRAIVASEIDARYGRLMNDLPSDIGKLEEFNSIYGESLRLSLDIPGDVMLNDYEVRESTDTNGMRQVVISSASRSIDVKISIQSPEAGLEADRTVVIIGDNDTLSVKEKLIGNGWRVISANLSDPCLLVNRAFYETDFLDTYNPTCLSKRVQQVLAVISFAGKISDGESISLVGFGRGGIWSLFAMAFAPQVKSAVIDLCNLDLVDDETYIGELYAPNLRQAGGIHTAMALAAPRPLMVHGLASGLDALWLSSLYESAGNKGALHIQKNPADAAQVSSWLMCR